MHHLDWKKYIMAFLITTVIFFTAMYFSNYFGDKKIAELQNIEDKIALDILSSETQFNLLREASCQDINNSILSQELNTLSSKLDYMEGQRGTNDSEVKKLKQYYSLLQIKDYLLMTRLGEKCKIKPTFILYFYSNEGDCDACEKEGYTLTYLRQKYPQLRIYSFDYNIELSAVKTLVSIYNVGKNLPALIVKGKTYYGYKDEAEIEKILPELATLSAEAEKLRNEMGTTSVKK